MKFSRLFMVELPFVLNLPNEDYVVKLDKQSHSLKVLQGQFAVPVGTVERPDYRIGSIDALKQSLGEQFQHVLRVPLRTIVQMHTEIQVSPDKIKKPSEKDLIDEYVRQMVVSGRTTQAGQGLIDDAKQAIKAMSPEELKHFTDFTAKKVTALEKFPNREEEVFRNALNTLIRLYMTHFKDAFVEELAFHQEV